MWPALKTQKSVEKVFTRPAAKIIHATIISVRPALNSVHPAGMTIRTAAKVLPASRILQGTRSVWPALKTQKSV